MQDDPEQAQQAAKLLQQSELVAVPVPVLCEFVQVLRRGCKKSVPEISDAIRRLMKSANVVMNRPAIETGISVLAGRTKVHSSAAPPVLKPVVRAQSSSIT